MKAIKTENPLISVIMPVYNAEKFLIQAIESILVQTFTDFEFIIVDDASTDGSWEIIKSYKKRFPRQIKAIHLTVNRNNGGDACANEGFKLARGAYIARMDADDIAAPDRFEKQIAYMEAYPDVILSGTQAYVIDAKGIIIGEKREPIEDRIIRRDYFMYHPIIHPSVMIRRSLLPKRNYLYRIQYNANNDLLTFFELMQYGKFANLPEKLVYYRIHGKNDSLSHPKGRFFNTLKIRLFAWQQFKISPSVIALFVNVIQIITVLVLPSSLISRLYMKWKGLRGTFSTHTVPKIPSFA